MTHSIRTFLTPLLLGFAASATWAASPQDWTIPAGLTVQYDTENGPVAVDRLTIEPGATLEIVGPRAFRLLARDSLHIAGTLDFSGQDNRGVSTLGTANIPEPGAAGGPGGLAGGVGSHQTSQSTARGGPGLGWDPQLPIDEGGRGGETSYSNAGREFRRAAGGGGGVFGPDRPSEASGGLRGLVAMPGFEGGPPPGLGAESQSTTAQGGDVGVSTRFLDGDPDNDFWGRKRTERGILRGELGAPIGGAGGGAGGDAVNSDSFPLIPFVPTGDEKGAGGGGGGGLGSLLANRIVIEGAGQILANGGSGGGGENTVFFDRVGGGSGGGSGGMILIHARLFDFRDAAINALQAVGGRGGQGADNAFDVTGAGGDGGPGLIQLHTYGGSSASILLPLGRSLDELCLPDAHVLLPADLSQLP